MGAHARRHPVAAPAIRPSIQCWRKASRRRSPALRDLHRARRRGASDRRSAGHRGRPQPRVRRTLLLAAARSGAAGLLLVAVAAAGAILAFSDEETAPALGTIGNGVAALDPASGEVAALIESRTAPSNVAVGEGAVWVLNTQDETVLRIDPKTKAVTGRLKTRGVPTDVAAGEGAVWVGNGGGHNGNFTVSISRIDPTTSTITRTVKLPNRTAGSNIEPSLNWGFPNIAVGNGGVWARNPDNTISRLDPETGKLVATIDVDADKIAAGREGVWFLEGSVVSQIDPRTNRTGQTISIGSEGTAAIAVGAGSIWVTAEQQGAVWRIEPGPRPETRSIDVGAGVTYIAFGAGAVWAANTSTARSPGSTLGRTP